MTLAVGNIGRGPGLIEIDRARLNADVPEKAGRCAKELQRVGATGKDDGRRLRHPIARMAAGDGAAVDDVDVGADDAGAACARRAGPDRPDTARAAIAAGQLRTGIDVDGQRAG
jgi:hypothetical protein